MQQEEPKKNEQEEAITEEYSLDKPDFIFLPKGRHVYRQQGYYLVCASCDLVHATFIGADYVMVGEKDGEPVIKKRKEVGLA